MGVSDITLSPSRRGYHILGTIVASYWRVLVIRLISGDDLKRLRLDCLPNKHAKNVLFTKKWKVKK